jgi:PadR family transcriptional regulator PadR
MERSYLGEFEELVLLAAAVLEGNAYGLNIVSELKDRTSRSISLSGVHVALYRLEEKGLLSSELGGATASRGGRRKRMFRITASGRQILDNIRQVRNELYNAIPGVTLASE